MIGVDTALDRVPTERLEAEVQTLAGHVAAAMCRWLLMVGELDRREAWRDWEAVSMAHWLSWKCGMSLITGRDHVRVARALAELPLVREQFAAGELSYSKARALCRLIAVPEIEADLVAMARHATAAQMDRIAAGYRRAQRLADPGRERRNHERRRWRLVVDDDGMGQLTVRASADVLAQIKAAADAAVKAEVPDDGDAREARMVDGLLAVARHYLQPDADEHVPTTIVVHEHGERPVAATPAPADDRDSDEADVVVLPSTLQGVPISRTAYERLRCDAGVAIERTLADGSISRTPVTDSIPRRIRRAVRARDLNTCRWPGCTNTAHLHVHHIVYRARGGRHLITNLVLLCSHHHTLIHLGLWKLDGDPNGRLALIRHDGRKVLESDVGPTSGSAKHLVHANRKRGCNTKPGALEPITYDPLHLEWTVSTILENEHYHRRRHTN